MISLLIKRFIDPADDLTNATARRICGVICGAVGIAINVILFLAKLTVGLLSGSIAVVADAFNNLSDAGSSIVTLVGFRLAAQAPDEKHPYGHGRFEYISGLIVSIAILLMGVELLRSGIGKILHPSAVSVSPALFAVLLLSIALKLYMALYNNRYGKKIDSSAMRATATDSLGDCAATGAVLLAALAGEFTSFNIDGWAGVIVAGLIFIAGVRSLKDTVTLLLGQAPSQEFIDTIKEIVNAHKEDAGGIHDLAVHDYGPGHIMVSLHLEVNGSDIYAMHEVVDSIEREISHRLGCETVIHMDPVANDSEQTVTVRGELEALIKERIDPDITIHDLRIVPGPSKTTLIFDSAVPARSCHNADAVKRKIESTVEENFENCIVVTKIDIQL